MMRLASVFVLLVLAAPAFAQRPDAGPDSCLIVKHKGTVGRRLIWTALVGIPIAPGAKYDYVDSMDFRSAKLKYGGKELQGIQQSGVHVIVLNNRFIAADLDSARRACSGGASHAADEGSGGGTLGVTGYATEAGFKIASIQPGSPAARIYLNVGDIIATIDTRKVYSGADIDTAVQASPTGAIEVDCLIQTWIGSVAAYKQVKLR
jgi:membrane-associated protease RseP (regulator of RpoE activity)